MQPSFTGETHKYLKLADRLRRLILSGDLRPGDRLPTLAQMQAQHGVGQWTLERAYAVLDNEKLVVHKRNCGFFVADLRNFSATCVIGVACGAALAQLPYHFHLLQGVREAAEAARVGIALLESAADIRWEKIDGVILTGSPMDVPLTMPTVTLTSPRKGAMNVVADDFQGVMQATQHLLSLGHTRIAFLNLNRPATPYTPGRERLRGYREALLAAGIEPKRNWVRPLFDPWDHAQPFADLGYEKVQYWLEEDWHKTGCTALLAYNDDAAQGALRAMNEAGLRVPEDVSVMGFDGTEAADRLTPPLSTVAVPLREIGMCGLELMMDVMRKPIEARRPDETKGYDKMLPVKLKIQQSTAPVKTL